MKRRRKGSIPERIGLLIISPVIVGMLIAAVLMVIVVLPFAIIAGEVTFTSSK